ncbi:unnamed protein product [Withania somnifera]
MTSLVSTSQIPSANSGSKGIQIKHPLDPLSAAEISVGCGNRQRWHAVQLVLLEPDKTFVALADAYFFPPFQSSLMPRTKGGLPIPSKLPPRRDRLIVYNKKTNETSIWIVQLTEVHASARGGHHKGKVISSKVVPDDAQEYADCESVVKNYPPFMEAMKRRGVVDLDLVMVEPWCVGYHMEADAPSCWLAKPLVFCRTESDCPMEMEMQYQLTYRKLVPLPPADPVRNYAAGETRGGADRSDVKPLQIIQPEGPSFHIDGNYVKWQKINSFSSLTCNEGLSISHRLSFVEMVVPYGDPNDPHYRKNEFDAGEDALGKNAHSLKRVKYFDANFTNFTGGVETIENCVCLHEEDHGMLWKHQDWRSGLAEVRHSRRLTVSFICTVANYEFRFYWHFYQDGKIEVEIKLTGILSLGELQPGESRKYGTTIHPLVAHMNMAVDCKPGEAHNQVVEVNVKVKEPGKENVHNNAFSAEETLLRSELQAMSDCDPLSARHWIVRNTRMLNRTGQLTGYKLVPGLNCLQLAGPEAKFLRRAASLKHTLWFTQYGLASCVKEDRSQEESDIVLWYVFGITHAPHLEVCPVMPVECISFMLLPHGFINCSPAVDVPPPQGCDSESKDGDVSENGVAKPSATGLMAKL